MDITRRAAVAALLILGLGSWDFGLASYSLRAQTGAPPQTFTAGTPLKQQPNVKTYGGFRFAESVSYDAERDLYVAVNAGMAQDVVPNDGYVSLVNPDGTAHTLKWIGVNRNGLTLNHPLGSDIANGMLYVVDIDRSEEHTSELQSLAYLVCRLLLEKQKHRIEVRTFRS